MAQVYILGAGTPTPTPNRFGTSYVLELSGERRMMFDCGPAATHKLVKVGLFPTQIDQLFFTHHHFDHDIDYPCFLLCRWDQSTGSENQLEVMGPHLTEKITNGILDEKTGLFAHDWIARVNHPLSKQIFVNRGGTLPRPAPKVKATDVKPGLIYSGDNWEVTAAPAEHVEPYLDSLAYRLDSEEGSVVFTGDTQPCDSVIEMAQGADMMLCMCWDDQDIMDSIGEGVGQCGTKAAARMAQEAGVRSLVLTHIGPHLSEPEPMEKGTTDVRSIYDGELIFSHELMTVPVIPSKD